MHYLYQNDCRKTPGHCTMGEVKIVDRERRTSHDSIHSLDSFDEKPFLTILNSRYSCSYVCNNAVNRSTHLKELPSDPVSSQENGIIMYKETENQVKLVFCHLHFFPCKVISLCSSTLIQQRETDSQGP